MNRLNSYADTDGLLRVLNHLYGLNLDEVRLHRDMIGHVYFVRNSMGRFVLKLYRSFNTPQALQSVKIIQYLMRNDYPVAPIIPTTATSQCIELTMPDGDCVGVLFGYIEGTEPSVSDEAADVGAQVGRLHRLMEGYQDPLIGRGKDFYIDRFIRDLRRLDYHPDRVSELEQYGAELWAGMEMLPRGFCHGDLHSGNMLQTGPGEYVLFDFDVASCTHSVIDVATLVDMSDFNRLEESAYDATLNVFERFHTGYSRWRTIGETEISAIFDFIAVRHYELIPTICECQGLRLSQAFMDQQFEWLMQWRAICSRKRH